jgi:excisionase family DNA binding protein
MGIKIKMNDTPNSENQAGSVDELLSFDEAIKFLDTSKSTLYKLLSLEELRGVKVGRQTRFRRADLTAYLERGPVAIAVDPSAHGELEAELAFFKNAGSDDEEASSPQQDLSPETKIIALANSILEFAVQSNCSDIHFDPIGSTLRLRFRIDGALHVIRQIPMSLHDPLITRFKEVSHMNVSEKRLPQDGRFHLQSHGMSLDVRASLLPSSAGDSLVLRILDQSAATRSLDEIGMSEPCIALLRSSLNRPSGMIIATGPLGSGKTLLMYSCLSELNSPEVKIVTSEEPVEYELPGVIQFQSKPRLGLALVNGLRSALGQDPDIVFCSELRDRETAEVAFDAAVKGVLLLSTIFANDSLSALVRLADMGIEPYLISSGLNTVVSTRLIRRLCPHCKAPGDQEESRSLVARLAQRSVKGGYQTSRGALFYEPVGCPNCRGTGFLGRMGIYELLVCNPKLVGQLIKCSSQDEMLQLAIESGMQTLLMDGIRKAEEGETSIAEVLRVTDSRM